LECDIKYTSNSVKKKKKKKLSLSIIDDKYILIEKQI